MTGRLHFTQGGLPGIELVPFGMHACHFYSTRAELAAALAGYFTAGLRGNERCFWVAAPPLPASEALQALRAVYHGVDEALEADALRVLDFDQWSSGPSRAPDVVQMWLGEEERALAAGYNGLRIAGNMSFLEPGDWPAFMEYEQAATSRFASRRIVALCSYELAPGDEPRASQITHAHHCAFERPGSNWQVVATAPGSSRVASSTGPGRDR